MGKLKNRMENKYIYIVIILLALIFDISSEIFSFWKGKFFATRFLAFLVSTYYFLKVLTNENKKLSKLGTIIICFSSATLVGINFDVLTFGQIFLIFLNKLTDNEVKKDVSKNDKLFEKVLYSIAMIISFIAYIFTFQISAVISFGYLFLALAIWILIKNRKKYKINGKSILIISIIMILMLIALCTLEYNTKLFSEIFNIYKVKKENNALEQYFSYIYNFLLPYNENIANKVEYASIISVFPVPIILAVVYLYKKEKHEEFLFPILFVITLEFVVSMIKIPTSLEIISGFALTTTKDLTLSVSLANVFIFIYMYANVHEEIFGIIGAMRLTILILIIEFFMPKATAFSAKKYMYLFAGISTLESFLMFSYKDKRYQNLSMYIMVLLTLIGMPILFLI